MAMIAGSLLAIQQIRRPQALMMGMHAGSVVSRMGGFIITHNSLTPSSGLTLSSRSKLEELLNWQGTQIGACEGSSQQHLLSREGTRSRDASSVWAVQMNQCVDSSPVVVVQLVDVGAYLSLQLLSSSKAHSTTITLVSVQDCCPSGSAL